MATSIDEFKSALKALEIALSCEKTDIVRDATIQRFEFCIELAWKTSKKVMGTSLSSPKQVIRLMAQDGLIKNVEFWLEAIDYRNLSVHTYREELAEEVYGFANKFLGEAKGLADKLEELA